jgi:hypothetical protein
VSTPDQNGGASQFAGPIFYGDTGFTLAKRLRGDRAQIVSSTATSPPTQQTGCKSSGSEQEQNKSAIAGTFVG